jgi:CPA2 family monovalent cation:H+ antiporter-2
VTLSIGSLVLTPLFLKTGLRWTRSASEQAEARSESTRFDQTVEQAIVIGAGPIGRQATSRLEMTGKDVFLVDLSPINLHDFAIAGFRTVAGDATDRATLELASVENVCLAVVSVPDDDTALRIVRVLRTMNTECTVLVRCRFQSNVSKLMASGADTVISEESEASNALLRVLDDMDSEKPAESPEDDQ